ncbi:carbohydrate esterase family 1 protein [Ceratobasidium sp. AG-Ba]|nr:carbohydrate esterase family 1 protein [Ceratobasidium sp. AG-Ba]
MKYSIATIPLALATLVAGLGSPDCVNLFQSSQRLIPGLRPYVSRIYPAGSDFVGVGVTTPAHNLTEFCRFGANYNTSSTSSIQFEVWLPTVKRWNGRFAHVGGGGDMGTAMTKYGFAVAGTNAGHNGTSSDGTFAISNPETQLDFGYRAVHLSTVFSKKIVREYYKKKPSYNYWIGCSTGGRQGMKEIQEYPDEYDGIAVTAPAQWFSLLVGWFLHAYYLNDNLAVPSQNIPASFFPSWNQEVLAQCDAIDGVKDKIILNPQACKPDVSTVVCGSSSPSLFVNASTCLSDAQARSLQSIYQDWTSSSGELLHPGYLPGSEVEWGGIVGPAPFQIAPDYFLYQVYNYSSVQPPLRVNDTELQRITQLSQATNPGRYNAANPNLKPFFRRGGKVLEFHGLSDGVIPTFSSVQYYDKVRTYTNSSLSKDYRLFHIPGMRHCGGGSGADGFGRPQQAEDYAGGAGQSPIFDRKHDSILALMEWVERGNAPDSIVGARYVNRNKTQGVELTRLFCPYPQEGKYIGGDPNDAASYKCE